MRITDLALRLLGATSGEQIIKSAAAASGAITLPAGTVDFSATGGASQVVKQTTAGGAFTVGQVAATDLSNMTAARLLGNPTGSAAVPSEISLGTNLSFAGTVLNAVGGGATGLSGMTAGQIPIAATAATVTSSANLSGDVVSDSALATTIQANAVTTTKILNANVTYAKIQNVANNRLLGNTSGSAAAPAEITLPLSAANGGTGLASGTSGGIPYFNTTTSLASSALLTVNALIKGGGAGVAPVASTATVDGSGNLTATGNATAANLLTAGGVYISGNTTQAALSTFATQFTAVASSDGTSGAKIIIGNTGNQVNRHDQTTHLFYDRTAATLFAQFDSTGAYKPGGGSWTATSDARLKRDVAPYIGGLAEIIRLRPVAYRYNGKGGTSDDGRVFTGLVADEVRAVMPELVGTMRAKLNPEDADETDLLTLDATPLIYALVNSVKELSARVVALEARSAPPG